MNNQAKRIRIPKFQGVYYRESSKRRQQGKPDKCFDISYKNIKGKITWEKVGRTSEGYSAVMASTVRAERLRAIRHGEEIPQKKGREPTLGEVWDKYDQWLETGKSRPKDDRILYANHLKSRFSNRLLSEITPFDLEKMKMTLTKKGLSPASVKHCLVLVRQIINKAIAWGMWKGENPVTQVKMPKLNNKRKRYLKPKEASRLLKEISVDYTYDTVPCVQIDSGIILHGGSPFFCWG